MLLGTNSLSRRITKPYAIKSPFPAEIPPVEEQHAGKHEKNELGFDSPSEKRGHSIVISGVTQLSQKAEGK
jgi:hypothetical protein